MHVYEPVGYFKMRRGDLEKLTRDVLHFWPEQIIFTDKTFGAFEEYKCNSFTEAYQTATAKIESADFGEWDELAPIVFDFVSRAIKHSSVYLDRLNIAQIDVSPIVRDMAAREDILIEDA